MKISRRKLIVLGGSALASSTLSMPAIASGEKIKVDTRTGEYVERAR